MKPLPSTEDRSSQRAQISKASMKERARTTLLVRQEYGILSISQSSRSTRVASWTASGAAAASVRDACGVSRIAVRTGVYYEADALPPLSDASAQFGDAEAAAVRAALDDLRECKW